MNGTCIGIRIKQLRLEKGIKQNELSGKLCSVSLLSKIENGRTNCESWLYETLLQRLGYLFEAYTFFLTEREWNICCRKEELHRYFIRKDETVIRRKLDELMLLTGQNDKLLLQFQLRMKAFLYMTEHKYWVAYKLTELALNLTMSEEEINNNEYRSLEELILYELQMECEEALGGLKRDICLKRKSIKHKIAAGSEESMQAEIIPYFAGSIVKYEVENGGWEAAYHECDAVLRLLDQTGRLDYREEFSKMKNIAKLKLGME